MQEQVSESVCRVVLVVCEDTECVCERHQHRDDLYVCKSKEVYK